MTGEDFATIMEKCCTDAMRREQEIERLRAALSGVLNCINNLEVDRFQWEQIAQARAALQYQQEGGGK